MQAKEWTSYVATDIVKKISPSKFYNKTSPNHLKRIWVIHCENNKLNLFEGYLEDKEFIKEVEDHSILNKKFEFTIISKGNFISKAKRIS